MDEDREEDWKGGREREGDMEGGKEERERGSKKRDPIDGYPPGRVWEPLKLIDSKSLYDLDNCARLHRAWRPHHDP